MDKIRIKIDVVSDVVCPWCYIGKRRLEKAISGLPQEFEVEVEFLPFELNPDMPAEGRNQSDYLSTKFGGIDRYHQITGHVSKVAAEEGLAFNFESQQILPNTLDAHRLIMIAKKEGFQSAVKEALMDAYFVRGVDLSSKENLVNIAVHAGLDRQTITDFLDSDEGTSEVRLQEQLNYQRGISGVPFYIINGKYAISGAQPSEVFLKALTEIGIESQPKAES